jgi:hypothetical protein
LGSISEFLENKGGDCEDYSLFYKAEYNYALSQCAGKDILLEGWYVPGPKEYGSTYWLTFQKTWFLDDVVKIDIVDHPHPNMVCGNLYDPNKDQVSGHCMLAFSNKRIESVADLKFLVGAYLIEPQDGSFKGNVNEENSKVHLMDEWLYPEASQLSYIDSVITDTDFFLFSGEDLQWQSYSQFSSLLHAKQEQVVQMVD